MAKYKITFNIISLFPKSLEVFLSDSIIGRAQKNKLIKINFIDLRKFGEGKRKVVDDKAYGGGAGMLLRVDIIDRAIKSIKKKDRIILLTPQGKTYIQKKAKNLLKYKNLVLICGHYEGFDERVRKLVDEEISIGDYVLTGGEIASLVIVDSVSRLVKGVLGKEESFKEESFENNLLEYPQYTFPREYKKMKVPSVLLSGNHAEIKNWRDLEANKRTTKKRPDLFALLNNFKSKE
jgi:tRNA (guanine37-N1)-methyltransferase